MVSWFIARVANGGLIMKLALIALGLLATTNVVYSACMFC
jgi:hypothetical protein